MTVPLQMPLHSRVSMEIYVPPLDKTISVRGEVVRCIASAAGGYEIGLRFEEIDPEDRLALNHSIKRSRSPKEHVRHRRSWWRRVS